MHKKPKFDQSWTIFLSLYYTTLSDLCNVVGELLCTTDMSIEFCRHQFINKWGRADVNCSPDKRRGGYYGYCASRNIIMS